MMADELVRRAESAGLRFRLQGCFIVLDAPYGAPPGLIERLRAERRAVEIILRRRAGIAAEVHHRLGMMKFGADDEVRRSPGLADCQPAERGAPTRCAQCGGAPASGNVMLPLGVAPAGPAGVPDTSHLVWVHDRCRAAFYEARRSGR